MQAKKQNLKISQHSKTAVLLGATGMVGSKFLELLLSSPVYKRVICLGRREPDLRSEKLESHVVDFDSPRDYRAFVKGDDLFLCLGTTMKKAGSKKAFAKVDFEYNYQTAFMASQNQMGQIFLLSAVGADTESLFFYQKVKGQLEQEIKKLDFWACHIFRPSLLLGERNEKRWGESIAQFLGKGIDSLTAGMLKKYKPVEAEIVAQAMYEAAQSLSPGMHVYASHSLQDMADREYEFRKSLEL